MTSFVSLSLGLVLLLPGGWWVRRMVSAAGREPVLA